MALSPSHRSASLFHDSHEFLNATHTQQPGFDIQTLAVLRGFEVVVIRNISVNNSCCKRHEGTLTVGSELISWRCRSFPFPGECHGCQPCKIEQHLVVRAQITLHSALLQMQLFHEVRSLILIPWNVYLLQTCHQIMLGWDFCDWPFQMSHVSALAPDFKLNGV